MTKVVVCPFGNLNLIVSLFEALARPGPGRFEPVYVSFTEYDRAVYERLEASHHHIAPGTASSCSLPGDVMAGVTEFSRKLCTLHWGHDNAGRLHSTACHYVRCIEAVLDREGAESVVLFNGRMNLVISALDAVARARGVDRLVFEQGLFRPSHITLDGNGVNYANSVDSLDGLLSAEPYPYQRRELFKALSRLLAGELEGVIDFKRSVPWHRLLAAYVKMKWLARGEIQLRTAEGRDLLEAALLRPRAPKLALSDFAEIIASDEYAHVVLCPLQVQTDTQVLLYSPLVEDMRQLVGAVTAAVREHNRRRPDKACVVFKIHPADPRGVDCTGEDAFLIADPPVPQLLEQRCDLVITINSTVGIEAIEAGVPVITLGNAFYSFPEVVAGHCEDLAQLPGLIEHALRPVPEATALLRHRFIDALRQKYQVPLNV